MRVATRPETVSETPSDTPSDTPSEPRAKRREAPRERAVPALRTRLAVATTVHGISQRMSPRKAIFRASTAHSGRNSSEFRRPVRGSECASQRIQKRFRNRLQSRERSGAKRRRNERSRRCSHGPPWPQLCAAFRNACQRGRRGCAQQPLTLAVVLPERRRVVRGSERASSAFGNDFGERRPPFAAPNARRGNCPPHKRRPPPGIAKCSCPSPMRSEPERIQPAAGCHAVPGTFPAGRIGLKARDRKATAEEAGTGAVEGEEVGRERGSNLAP